MDKTETTTTVIDLNTAAGAAAWMKQLPTENLKAIAARTDLTQILLICAAEGELIVRGEL